MADAVPPAPAGAPATRAGAHLSAFLRDAPAYLYFAVRWALLWASKGDRISLRSTLLSLEPGARVAVEPGGHLSVGDGSLRRNALITVMPGGRVHLGDGFFLGQQATLCCLQEISIGRNVLLAERVSIYDHDHVFARTDIPFAYQGLAASPVRIGNNVWLGANVFVTRGVTIGDNVVVGAGTVVTRDIPSNTLAYGRSELVFRPLG